jgi:hypothetical protein
MRTIVYDASSRMNVYDGACRKREVMTLRVKINYQGVDYAASQAGATNVGNFISKIGGFTQECHRADIPALHMIIFFRPDVGGGRNEVVFELGSVFDNDARYHMLPYVATIYDDATVLATVNMVAQPVVGDYAHFWFSRWRWQSSERPWVGDINRLIAEGLLPPYRTDLPPQPVAVRSPYQPMGLGSMNPSMGDGGNRDEIGILIAPQAEYICMRNPACVRYIKDYAEVSGTWQWHQRDGNTGAPLSFITHPDACWYQGSSNGEPFVPIDFVRRTASEWGGSETQPVTQAPEDAHTPSTSYFIYLMTGDPYHLEEMQFQSTYHYGHYSVGFPEGRPRASQVRQWAWNIRHLGQRSCKRLNRCRPGCCPSRTGKSLWIGTPLTLRRSL